MSSLGAGCELGPRTTLPSFEELITAFNGPPPEAKQRSEWMWYAIGTLLRAQQCSSRQPAENTENATEEPQVLGFGTIKRQLAWHVLPLYPKCHLYRVSHSSVHVNAKLLSMNCRNFETDCLVVCDAV